SWCTAVAIGPVRRPRRFRPHREPVAAAATGFYSRAALSVTLSPRALRLADRDLPLFSGALHYFRVAPRHWGRCLRALREMGFPAVESYVPWGVHETRRGAFDWSGARD